jgi:hypothetical protein
MKYERRKKQKDKKHWETNINLITSLNYKYNTKVLVYFIVGYCIPSEMLIILFNVTPLSLFTL